MLIAHLASVTERIRLGSGGVMLPNHAPLVIAEQFGMLEALHPGRIDLGIGRAPGTDPRTAAALRRTAEPAGAGPPRAARRALRVLQRHVPRRPPVPRHHRRARPGNQPAIWLLGSSDYSARLAGLLGLPFSFAHHFSAANTLPALDVYRRSFRPSDGARGALRDARGGGAVRGHPRAGDVPQQARRPGVPPPALGSAGPVPDARGGGRLPPDARTRRSSSARGPVSRIVGDPDEVGAELAALLERTGADELMVTTMVHGHDDRVRSYRLLAELAGLEPSDPGPCGHTDPVPEGDTLYKTAARMKPALQGHVLTRFEAPRLRGDAPKLGERIELVEARGKHLLVHFDGGLVLRTHLRMTGSWHVYRERERWRKPAYLARAVVGADSGWLARVLPGAGRGDLPPRRGRSRRRSRASAPTSASRVSLTDAVLDQIVERAGRLGARGHDPRRGAARPADRRRHRQRLQVRGVLRGRASTPPRRSRPSTSPRGAGSGRSPPASSRPTSGRRSAAPTRPGWPSTAAAASPATAAAPRSAWPATATWPGAPTGAPPASRRPPERTFVRHFTRSGRLRAWRWCPRSW